MTLRYLLFALATLILVTASDPYYGTELNFKPAPKPKEGDVREIPWRATDAFNSYLEDYDNRVADEFAIATYYEPMVRFWFLIYTQFESTQVVFHDKGNMSLIYRVLDFSYLHKKDIPRNTLYILQEKITKERIKEMKMDLARMAENPFSVEPHAKEIYESLRRSGISIPVLEKERREFFKTLADNVRAQTGQKNFIRDGIVRSQPYLHFLRKYFSDRTLPAELISIAFLESSFNPLAHSKVNALGIWQFMPLIASYFVPKRTDHIDYRSNVGVASISAAFLMEENFKILKSWDLAVTAYNSGTKHLLKTKRELASSKIDLEEVIKHSDSNHFGFASKNFYSEFLALAHTLAYAEEIYKELHRHDREDVDQDLNFYLLKCPVFLDHVLTATQMDDVLFHNNHLKDDSKKMHRGLILTAKSNLPASRFFKLDDKQIHKIRPIHWEKLLKDQSCSTK